MSANLLAMHAVLTKLDTHIKDGKIYKTETSQEPFWVQVADNNQLRDGYKGTDGQVREFYTADTLRIAVGYFLRGNKAEQYAKIKGKDAMNMFFATGREMVKQKVLADIENAGRASGQGTYVPEVKMKKSRGKGKEKEMTGKVVLKIPSPRTLKQAEEKRGDTEPNQEFVPVSCESTSMEHKSTTMKRPRTSDSGQEDRPQKRIKIQLSPPSPADGKKRKPTNDLDTAPTGKRIKQESDNESESPVHHLSKPPLGSISQAEILEDLKTINIAITDVLAGAGSSFPYKPSSPVLCFANSPKAMILEVQMKDKLITKRAVNYQPSSPNLSTKPMSREVIWSRLITDIFSEPHSPILLIDPTVQRTVNRTCHIIGKGIDVDGVEREVMLWEYRDESSQLELYGDKGEILTILQKAVNLKAKMDVSREKFEIVRDDEGGWTGVVKYVEPLLREDFGYTVDSRGLGGRFVSLVDEPVMEKVDSVMG